MLIDRIERKIDELDTKANSAFRTFGERADALSQQFSKVTEEIEIQKKAYEAYMQKANSISLSQDYKNKVMSGELRIEDITDEDLNDKISEFEDWYEIMPIYLVINK